MTWPLVRKNGFIPESRLRTLGQTLWALHTGSTKAVKITCDQCGNMVFFDAYKIGAIKRPENPY